MKKTLIYVFGVLLIFVHFSVSTTLPNEYATAQFPVIDVFSMKPGFSWLVVRLDNVSRLLYTETAGAHWQVRGTNLDIRKLFFLDRQIGWAVVDEVESNGHAQYLFSTRDGGLVWNRISLLLPANDDSNAVLLDFVFLNAEAGWFVAQDSHGSALVFYTEDGGRTIKQETTLSGPIFISAVLNDDDDLWLVGFNHIVFRARDSKKWISEPVDKPLGAGTTLFRGIAVDHDLTLFVGMAQGGAILSTRDHGKHIQKRYSTADANNLFDVAFWSPNDGCAVGDSQSLYCTYDGGTTWIPRDGLPQAKFQQSRNFTRIFTFEKRQALLLREGGYLYRSSDGFHTWENINDLLAKAVTE
jgi:photosystem II stability/assembly factor-like uncharacterized protein